MANPDYSNIILGLGEKIDALNQTFVHNGYTSLSQTLAKPIGTLCVLFIIFTGYGIMRGLIKTPMRELVNVSIRIGLVYMFAFNWGEFSGYVVDLFVKGSSELSSVMMKANPINVPQSSGAGINGALQSVFTEIISVGTWAIKKASFRNLMPLATGTMICISGMAIVGLAFFEIVLAKLMLSICLATAPLFISFTLFEKTRSFFDKWLGALVGFSLVLVFVSTVVGICLSLAHWVVAPLYNSQGNTIGITDYSGLVLVAILSIMAILEVTNVAKGIGGSCSSGTGSAMVGGFLGSALRFGKSGSKMTGLTKLASMAAGSAKQAAGAGLKRAGSAAMRGVQKRLRGG